jgi:hypothetical protein
MSETLKNNGYTVFSTDLINRGYGKGEVDFLKCCDESQRDIVTNPPYKYATEFVYHALDVVSKGCKVAMFLKLQFLEGKKRKKLFEKHPPKTIYVSSSRLLCAKNGDFKSKEKEGSAVAYAWYVWEKGYEGDTVIKWIN